MARKKVVALDCDSTVDFKTEGQEVSGYYLGYKTITTDYGPSKLHIFNGEAGNFGIFGGFQLDTKLADVPKGVLTFVIFEGKSKLKGGKTMKNYSVEYDDDYAIDVSSISSNASGSSSEAEEDDVDDSVLEEEEEVQVAATKRPLSKGSPAAASKLTSGSASSIQALLDKGKR